MIQLLQFRLLPQEGTVMIKLQTLQWLLRLHLLLPTSLATTFKSNVKNVEEDLVFAERKSTVRAQETKMEARRRTAVLLYMQTTCICFSSPECFRPVNQLLHLAFSPPTGLALP